MSGLADPGEPRPGRTGGEVEHLLGYLAFHRGEAAAAVLALTPEQQRTPALGSGWTPLELLSHLVHMEGRWFVWGFLGEPVEEPFGDWLDGDPHRDDPRWHVPDDVTADQLVARMREGAGRTERLLRSTPPDTPGSTAGRFADQDPVPDLRWICFHVLHEYARHAGHLDAAVELLHDRRS